jgi:hypothetical protein
MPQLQPPSFAYLLGDLWLCVMLGWGISVGETFLGLLAFDHLGGLYMWS